MADKIKTTVGELKKELSKYPESWPILVINGGEHNVTKYVTSTVYLLTIPYVEKE